ncbi:MAG: ASKHA domain-containing protein, partial [Clostridiales bacterium]
VDLGMNSEIILAGRGRLLAASVPTMPFEGAGISCGAYGVTGAITRVFIDQDVMLRTVRDGKPTGLCGAGLISAIHALLEAGMLDGEGRLLVDPELPERLAARFKGTVSGRRFILSPGEEAEQDIYIDQDDIRQFQLAKGGVFAACQAVMAEVGITVSDIEQILLAESYGAHIRPVSALSVGLLPNIGVENIRSIGNGAWQGAYLALGNRLCLDETEKLAAALERLDLSANMVFAESFMTAMNFV